MTTNLTITKAGEDAIALATLDDANVLTITNIAVGAGVGILPDPAAVTALQNEISRAAFFGDSASMPAGVAGYGQFEGGEAWEAWEIGIFARSGDGPEFLFAYAQAADNSSGIPTPLLVKIADESVRYDFSLVFAPADFIPRIPSPPPPPPPAPCAATPTRFATEAEVKARMPVAAALKPSQQQQWCSINKREPTPTDASFPVGHRWMKGKNEWMLESVTDNSTALWRQTRGIMLIYELSGTPPSNDLTITIQGERDITDYNQILFVAGIEENAAFRYTNITSPVITDASIFADGVNVSMVRSNYDIVIDYVNARQMRIRMENRYTGRLAKIYGIL